MKSALWFTMFIASFAFGLNSLAGTFIETAKARHEGHVQHIDQQITYAQR